MLENYCILGLPSGLTIQYSTRMAQYILIYGQPHASIDDGAIVYETARLPAEHFDNQTALRWARDMVPRERAALFAEHAHLAKPMALWRVDTREKALVWETEPGTAWRLAG